MAVKTFCEVAAVGEVEATLSIALCEIWIVDVGEIDNVVNGGSEEWPGSRLVMIV